MWWILLTCYIYRLFYIIVNKVIKYFCNYSKIVINSDELEPRDFFFRIKFFDYFQNRKLFFTIYFNFEQVLYDKNIKQNCYTIIIVFSIILLKEKLYNIYFIEIFYKNFQKNSKWYKLEYVIHILHIIFHTS